jgi:KaiC/GvpD/RAD55 family RecA-like ATPase
MGSNTPKMFWGSRSSGNDMALTVEDFSKYKRLGLSIVGIPKAVEYLSKGKSKKRVFFPKSGWAKFQDEFATSSEIDGFVREGSDLIGLITGPLSGIVVIDVDEANSEKYSFLSSPMMVKSSLSGGTHYYYRWGDYLQEFGNATKIMGYEMDYRGRGGLVFAPGSVVRKLDGSLGTYDFIGEMNLDNFDRSKLPELPEEIIVSLKEDAKLELTATDAHGEEFLDMPELHEGNRNAETVRVIGAVLAKSDPAIWETLIYPAIRIWNQEKVKPPQEEHALRSSWDQIVAREMKKREQEVIFNVKQKTDFSGILQEQIEQQLETTFLSGYVEVDQATGGFRFNNVYLVAGLEKSGKSSWLMGMLQNKLNTGSKIGYVNTEMPILEFARRMSAYWKYIPYDDVTNDLILEWSQKFSGKFSYLGVESLTTQEQMIVDIGVFAGEVDCLVFDNITSWGNKMVKGKESWQVTADLIDQLIRITKKNQIVTFMVMHMRPDIIVNSTVKATEKTIQNYKNNPEDIFEKSESFIRKPTLADVYGGGSALSQISGAVLIWRPYQKFVSEEMNSYTQIILESFRHSAQASLTCFFEGKTGVFISKKDRDFDEQIVSHISPKTNLFGEKDD